MKKFLLSLIPMGVESAQKRRERRKDLAYQIVLEQQIQDLRAKLGAAEERAIAVQAAKNDVFEHLRTVSSMQEDFIEVNGLRGAYLEFAETVHKHYKQKDGAAV